MGLDALIVVLWLAAIVVLVVTHYGAALFA
jgi:hypothetical protein